MDETTTTAKTSVNTPGERQIDLYYKWMLEDLRDTQRYLGELLKLKDPSYERKNQMTALINTSLRSAKKWRKEIEALQQH